MIDVCGGPGYKSGFYFRKDNTSSAFKFKLHNCSFIFLFIYYFFPRVNCCRHRVNQSKPQPKLLLVIKLLGC